VSVHKEFSHESVGERILKIGPHLPKLLLNIKWLRFLGTQFSLVVWTGYIMLAKSTGQYGDQTTLTSTIHNYSEPTTLKFSYYVQQVDASTEGTLLVYLLSIHRAPVKKLFSSESQPSNEWQEQELCIPAGTYYVQFVARLGLPFKSDIGLDDVQLTDRRCTVDESLSDAGNLIIQLKREACSRLSWLHISFFYSIVSYRIV